MIVPWRMPKGPDVCEAAPRSPRGMGSRLGMGIRCDDRLTLDDGELAHHAAVFVLGDVAVEHVRPARVGVVAELDQQADVAAWGDVHGVVPALNAGGGCFPSMLRMWNWTSWMWMLCGIPWLLVTVQISLVPAVTTWSMRARSIGRLSMVVGE